MPLSKQTVRDLNRLADHLDTVPRKRFAYGAFAVDYATVSAHSCGTAGCALGHAVEIPAFARRGLRMSNQELPLFRGHYGFGAGAEFFAISEDESLVLFDPNLSELGDKATPKQVARHIRKFIRDRSQ